MKIDNSVLQAAALTFAGIIAIMAAVEANWNVVSMAMTGFFGALSIHPKQPGSPPDADAS